MRRLLALLLLFAVCELSAAASVVRRAEFRQNAPPLSAFPSLYYLVGTLPTGAWLGQADKWATYNGLSWSFESPVMGDVALVGVDYIRTGVADSPIHSPTLYWNGSAWEAHFGGFQTDPILRNANTTVEPFATAAPVHLYKNDTSTPEYTLPYGPGGSQFVRVVIVSNSGASGDVKVIVASPGVLKCGTCVQCDEVEPDTSGIFIFVEAGVWHRQCEKGIV